jgi:hypothetical protein
MRCSRGRRVVDSGHDGLRRRARNDWAAHSGFDGIPYGAEFSVAGGGRRLTVMFVMGYPAAQTFSPPGAPVRLFGADDGPDERAAQRRRPASRRAGRRVPHRRQERMNPADVAVARFSAGT